MNLYDYLILVPVAAWAVFAVKSLFSARKHGCIGCSGCCSSCTGCKHISSEKAVNGK